MPIQNFDFPGVAFRQTFDPAPANTLSTLGVACVGTQYQLHKADSKDAVKLTLTYDSITGASNVNVQSTDGATIDTDKTTQHLVVKDGIFKYATLDSTDDDIDITVTAAERSITFNVPIANGGGHAASMAMFGSRGVRVGDPIQINGTSAVITTVLRIDPVDNVGFAKVVVGDLGGLTSATSVDFCVLQDQTYEADSFTLSGNTLSINGNLTTMLVGFEADMPGTLLDGTFYFEFRESMQEYVNKLGIISSNDDIEDILGTPCKDNPLALAVKFAFDASGDVVYFTGVADESVASYEDALEFLAKYDGIYSIVPVTEDKNVINACITLCTAQSEDEESTIRRAVWYGITADATPIIGDQFTATTATSSTTVTVTSTTIPYSDTAYKYGDKLRLMEDPYTEFAIAGINGSNLTLAANAGVTLTNKPFTIVRTIPTSADIIDNVIARRANQSERAVCVWADGLQYNGEDLLNYPLAAAAAGMRCAEAPHRPLSNLGYTSFTLSEPVGLNKAQLKRIGANGIWIIANNQDGTPINMRQVTTAVANNINLDEESIIANADTIAMAMCQVGRSYVGNSNITPDLLNALESDIRNIMDSYLQNTSGSIYIGPQLTDWEFLSIYQDPVNLDHVYAEFTCTPPKPFNKFFMHMRVI